MLGYIIQNAVYYQITSSQMDQQLKARQTQRSLTAESLNDEQWSQSSHTYYYSKFQLFQDSEEINQFYRYSVFVEKLYDELGEQWRTEAHYLYSPFFNNQDVFMNLLSTWLQMHPIVNTVHQNPLSKQAPPVFNGNFVDQFVARIKAIHEDAKLKSPQDLKINFTSTKTVCMGFFITANEIWQEMFRAEEKNVSRGFSLLKGVTKKIQSSFEPLMVVTEKISNLFGRKKRKLNQNLLDSSGNNDKMFGDCYMEFRRTMGLEKQLQRKMSEFNLDDSDDEFESTRQKKKIVTKDQFNLSQSPMQKNVIGNIYDYVTKFLKRKHPWQVASSFVTNILDINQISMDDGTKVKVLKPAEDFYQKLIIGWLMLRKCHQDKNISFDEYLQHIKISFGRSWHEKYLIPTKYFYERLIAHWHDIQKQTAIIKLSEKEILNSLINKIRESMREDWQRKIKIDKRRGNEAK